MEQRILGSPGLSVSELGLGCMSMSFAYGPRDDEESARTLNRALDLGVSFLDTADQYGSGHNEQLIGRVLGKRRDEFRIATKFGYRPPKGTHSPANSNVPGVWIDTSPEYVREACDASLERLGFDHIDLYYANRRNPHVPIEDTIAAMAGLIEAGKIGHIGLSEVTPETLRAAHAVHPVAAAQMEYSLFTREVEDEMLETCRELGVALVAYAPMGHGMLTGAITNLDELSADDFRRSVPRFAKGNFEANLALVAAVGEVADEIGASSAQTALAWLLAQKDLVIPIPGTKRVRYVEENSAAADITLSPAQVARIDAIAPAGAVAGGRYAEDAMRLVNR